MSFKKNFVKSILVSGGYNYLSQAISFFSTVIISRLLTPESYGFVGIITIFTGFLSIFSDSGISLAVIRSDYQHTYHKSVDTLALIIGCVLCVVTSILAFPISLFFKNTELTIPMMVMSLSFIFRSITLVRGALISKAMNFGFTGFVNLVTTIITILITIVMAYAGAGYWSLIIPQVLSGLINLILQERKLKFGFQLYSWAHVKVAYRYTKRTIGNIMGFNIVNYWARNSDNLLVGRMFGASDLGIYNRAYNLLTVPLNLITGLIGTVLYPSLNKLKGSMDAIRSEYLFILKMINFISFPVAFILLMFYNQLVMLLWGPVWIGVAQLLPYFGLLLLSQSLLSTVGNMLVLVEREEVLRISGWIGAAAMISGICYGASISMVAIAQFYSLTFIVVVLPVNLFYVYIKALGFSAKTMTFFWGPNILLSLGLWFSCYYHMDVLKMCLLFAFFVNMLIGSRIELVKILKYLNTSMRKA
ncbi:oligosaccharide flippase family protein [Mucilaginibacter sp. Bleaf8]|uniref:oligosaccharide flippase family protein n=1 Tax=Mucilaginibacter sp. Bleaf8 TaxID=2834430 RepID=UPI001BCBA204|nr:oligosaccharide flippase family protein [Mucilaginibacter sp. Bleaf8]MBS7562843.1 oligosaccharide flippase family protein [Mucilaginibacter sp. Bleaf8]